MLTTGFWPTYKVDEVQTFVVARCSFLLSLKYERQVTLPHELLKCVDTFTRFYESRTSHRKLKWIHTLGTSTVIGRFDPKPIELVCPDSKNTSTFTISYIH